MHLPTHLATTILLILSTTVFAQITTVPDPARTACVECMRDAGWGAVPACKGLENSSNNSSTPNNRQLQCWCGSTANKTWFNKCISTDKCSAATANLLMVAVMSVTNQPGVCDKVSLTSSASHKFSGSIVMGAAGATMAIVGAIL
ncbi:hypothetical protein FBU30_008248 [Linnemannia zychae]|nr:hypothetical protein FBU30_008248 [Linnemannia zychae]